jgi:hypothetical protein
MPITVFDLTRYTPKSFEYEPLNIFGSIHMVLSQYPRTIGIILYSTQNPRHLNLGLNTIRQLAINGE